MDLSGSNNNKQKNDHSFFNKWSPEIEAYGFTQVPNILLTCQGDLNLKHSELVALLQLMSFWFEHKSEVYPSIRRLARRSNKNYSTLQRNLKSLEKKGFIRRRHVMGSSDRYDLKPCAAILYKHQRSCSLCREIAQKREIAIVKVSSPSLTKTTNKEYPTKRLNKYTNNKHSKAASAFEIINSRYFGETV